MDAHTVLIHGGFTQEDRALGDLHVLMRNVVDGKTSFNWGSVRGSGEAGTRLWHAGILSSHSREVVFFGGCKKGFKKPCMGATEDPCYSNDVFAFKFEAPTLRELCCETICKRASLRHAVKCGQLLPKVVRSDLLKWSELLQIDDSKFVPQSPRRVRSLKRTWVEPTTSKGSIDDLGDDDALSQLRDGGGSGRESLPPSQPISPIGPVTSATFFAEPSTHWPVNSGAVPRPRSTRLSRAQGQARVAAQYPNRQSRHGPTESAVVETPPPLSLEHTTELDHATGCAIM